MTTAQPPRKSTRGFASMSPERLREVSMKGGAGAAPHKRAFSVDRELAANAGRKGGTTAAANRKPPSDAEG